jgi:hypothetical protein
MPSYIANTRAGYTNIVPAGLFIGENSEAIPLLCPIK